MGKHSHEKYSLQLEAAAVFFWLLKDMTWLLLFPPLAFPAALGAIYVESRSLLLGWASDTAAMRVHGAAAIIWLLGNSVWMAFEMLFEPRGELEAGRDFPWRSGPFVAPDEGAEDVGVAWATALFVGGLWLLLAFYVVMAVRLSLAGERRSLKGDPEGAAEAEPCEEQPLIFGVVTPEVYRWVFICPWILKDICWTCELLAPGLACGAVVLALVLDCLRRFRSALYLAELLWVSGNIVWMVIELALDDASRWPRVATACMMLIGVPLTAVAFATAIRQRL